ncbi:MAG: hypothetical protein NTV54_04570, partial [Ignavibacteriales bacterium]|nr:hypothetical protein [Ignavibacteriales bacterium]
ADLKEISSVLKKRLRNYSEAFFITIANRWVSFSNDAFRRIAFCWRFPTNRLIARSYVDSARDYGYILASVMARAGVVGRNQ